MLDLCGHEYAAINRKALVGFVSIAPRFGKKSIAAIKPSFTILTVPGTTYAEASGALSLLAQDVSMKNIASDWESTLLFIRMVLLCPRMIEVVEENDKRANLMSKLTNLFVKYVESWHHYPIEESAEQSQSVSSLYQLLLSMVGMDLKGKSLAVIPSFASTSNKDTQPSNLSSTPALPIPSVPSAVMSDTTDELAGRPTSLRHTLFIAFLLLHFIGHDDVIIPPGVVAWAVQTVSTAHGQPIQVLLICSSSPYSSCPFSSFRPFSSLGSFC